MLSRSPQGEYGLKSRKGDTGFSSGSSLPARGVWIEIVYRIMECLLSQSLPARGVWIEIGEKSKSKKEFTVAPRKGSVD